MQAKITLLNQREIQEIHACTLEVLEKVGISIGLPEIKELLLKNGGIDGGGDRVLFPEKMVMEALSKCPSGFSVYGSDGREYPIGQGRRPLISTCLVDPEMNSPEGNRPPQIGDCARNARIIDGEELIDIPYKMDLTYSDVEEANCEVRSNLAYMTNTTKPMISAPQKKRDAEIVLEMAQIMACGDLAERPNIMMMISPSSPLALHEDCLEMLQSAAARKIPVISLPCPMNGLTSPVSVIGTVLTINAENLALITVLQLLSPGNKVLYHTVAQPADRKTLEARMTGPEKMLETIAASEMGRYYGLPVGIPISSTETSAFDIQNGAESMSQIYPGVLAGANVLTGVGSNTCACGTSAEQILLDCQMVRLAMRSQRGLTTEGLRKSFEQLRRIGPGGAFIEDDEVLDDLMDEDIFVPELFYWPNHAGPETALARARKKADVLAARPSRVSADKIAALEAYANNTLRG